MRRNWLVATAVAVAIGFGLAGGTEAANASSGTSSTPSGTLIPLTVGHRANLSVARANTATTCSYTNVIPTDRYKGLPPSTPDSSPFTALMITTQGVIGFQAETTAAPCTTNSFRFLADHGYYDLTHCHRLTLQGIYVLQCGDPTGTGSGGPGYQFNDENLSGATYPAGTVAMANAGPNTNGSQYFICWKASPLPPLYTPFGKVTSGMDVLQKIATAGDDQQNGPGDGYPNLYVGIVHMAVLGR
ncbi:MAG TPA: peptidylprolyl isomerase [Actinocrinis sp.]|jgi:peptidyl-prolyl cis-trans isomerase B (cyclophilin B)|uniref:peptidylprolyl isomerase n=1 Tax=Actinocrinis sp. TaxID=1920516 RepID=UPI002DDCEB65|nr:peptidylprolyl isomerase [Actinocrinis sp.]HEV3172357.1 peptidylprolyl isomerase [Actinocrinis sp.]